MSNFLDSVTSKGKKFKERLKGKKGKQDKAGDNTAEGSISSSSPFPRPVPHVTAGGHDEERSGASADTRQVHSRDRPPQPESALIGGRDDDEGKEAKIGGKVVEQSHSHLEPNVETVVGGGPGLTDDEVGPLAPSPSTPILHGGNSESTWTRLFHLLYLIVPSNNAEPSAAPDQAPELVSTDQSAEPGPAASEEKSNWRSTAIAAAKLLLRGVRDSADAFGPLKSVAGGLCFVLDNYEVRLAPWKCLPAMFTSPTANEGKHTGDTIAGSPGRSPCGVPL